MTTVLTAPVVHTVTEVPRRWKTSIVLAVMSVVAFVAFGLLGDERKATVVWSDSSDAIVLPDLPVTSRVLCLVLGVLMLALAAFSLWYTLGRRRVPLWLIIVFGVLAVFAFLVWAGAGGLVPVSSLLVGAVSLSVPLVFGALCTLAWSRLQLDR